jgi:hypothetical protein
MSNKVYLETTIPSYLAAKPARDLLQAARQQLTHDWWDQERAKYELFVSEIVIDEVSAGDQDAAERRLKILDGIPLLEISPEINDLTKTILRSKLIPPRAARDAVHISISAVHEIDFLLTWNCKHIANATIMKVLTEIITKKGFEPPTICTPDTMLGKV